MEQGLMTLFNQKYNSSLLKGPWTIIYGLATLIIFWIGDKTAKINLKKWQQVIIFLISAFLILSIVEMLAGILIEKVLGIVYWDYSDLPLHIGKYSCVLVSLIWTAYAGILNYFIYPWVKKIIPKIPNVVTFILIALFLVDVAYSIFEFLKFR